MGELASRRVSGRAAVRLACEAHYVVRTTLHALCGSGTALYPGFNSNGQALSNGHRAVLVLYAPMAKKVAISGAGALISTTTDASKASRP